MTKRQFLIASIFVVAAMKLFSISAAAVAQLPDPDGQPADMTQPVTLRGNVYQHASGPVLVVLADEEIPGLAGFLPMWDIINCRLEAVMRKNILNSGLWTLLPGTVGVTYTRTQEG